MNNLRIAEVFDLVADLLEFHGENPFRVRAYRNGARTIHDYPEQMEAILADPRAQAHRDRRHGQGPGRQDGHALRHRQAADARRAASRRSRSRCSTLLRIPGLGPKKAAVLYNELKISTLDQLRPPARPRRFASSKGLARRPRKRFWPAWPWPKRSTSA